MSQESLLVVVVPANGEWRPMPTLYMSIGLGQGRD